MTLLAVVLLLFVGSIPPLIVRRASPTMAAWSAAIPTFLAFGLLASLGPTVFAGDIVRARWDWVPAVGLGVSLRVDGLAWMFGMLVLGIGLLIQLYARYYMPARDPLGRFFAVLMLFTASMTGLVLSGNLVLLVVFWELTSLSSFLLIGYWTTDPAARSAARTALTVTAAGGLALLAGALLLGRITGSMELDVVLASRDLIQASPLYLPALVLVLLGAFTKSAQVPFHFWLPQAMAAPTPVSAFLHSATMVKAGVFLLARLYPALAGTSAWVVLVGGVGAATLLYAAYTAMWQHDLKGLLAYSTISHLGLITLLFGFSTPTAAVAGVFHILNHATFKASLFMAAGIIDHEAGTRDMRVLNGLWRYMPYTAGLAIVAAAAMAGVPLLNGFLSKEMFFAAAVEAPSVGGQRWIQPGVATLAAAFSVAYSLRFILEVFFNDNGTPLPRQPHEPPRFMRVPVEILTVLCVVVGVAPAIMTPLLTVAATSVIGASAPAFSLSLWHGLSVPLLMTVAALVGGAILYRARVRLYAWHDRWFPKVTASAMYDRLIEAGTRGADRVTRAVENGSLQRYVMLLVVTALAASLSPLRDGIPGLSASARTPWDAASVVALLLLVAGTAATTIWHRRRFTAVVTISAVGLIVSLAFVRLSAPDLALTQLLVEMVTILLLLLALHYLPATVDARDSAWRRSRDAAIALAAGTAVAALAWAVLAQPVDSIAGYFIAESLPKGGGRNIVNVILVDFRGFDTLGEITVLAVAALGVLVLLDRVQVPPLDGAQPLERFSTRHPALLATMSRPLLPLVLLASLFFLLRGHDLPGGGFIAGLIAAVVLIAQYMANGNQWAGARLSVDFRHVTAAGVLLAAGTGAAAWMFGRPFLTSAYQYVPLPLIGKVPMSSALLFDVGVYLTVMGAVMLILERLGRMGAAHARAEAVREPPRLPEATWNS